MSINMNTSMRIKEFSVTNLFGRFNYIIPLNMEDRITIIHGRNGFGKTTLLKLINAIFNSRYMLLLNSGNRIIIRIKF